MITTPASNPRRHILGAVILWIVFTLIGITALVIVGPHLTEWGVLPPVASQRTAEVDQVLFQFTLLSIPVFCLVVVFSYYCALTWGSRRRPQAHGPAMLVSPRFQTIWLVVSVLLVAYLYVFGLQFLNSVSASAGPNALKVNVNGEQWLWDYSYPQYGNINGTTLELVVNRPVTFTITSTDVQHSFWIPALGIKQDAVPGQTTSITVTPTVLGDYVVRCAELCGLYHSYMETPVHVVSVEAFDAWVTQQPTPAPTPTATGYTPPHQALAAAVVQRPRWQPVVEG